MVRFAKLTTAPAQNAAAAMLLGGALIISSNVHAETVSPPRTYCDALTKTDALQRAANKLFAPDGSDGKWAKRMEWIAQREEKLMRPVSKELRKDYAEWSAIAYENNWMLGCDAQASGWVVVGRDNLQNVSNDDVSRTYDAIQVEYSARLERAPDKGFFDPSRYSVASCDDVEVDGYHFVGCRMRSVTASTDYDVYLVANKDGKTIAVPYDSEAKSRVKKQTSIAMGSGKVELGFYVGEMPLVAYSKVRNELN